MELSDFSGLDAAQERGIEVVITDPRTLKPSDVVITIAGPDSKRRRDEEAAIMRRRIEAGAIDDMTQDDYDAEAINILAAATIDWRGLTENGEPLPCTRENAERLYRDYAFIRRQVDAKSASRAAFLAVSSGGSKR